MLKLKPINMNACQGGYHSFVNTQKTVHDKLIIDKECWKFLHSQSSHGKRDG